MSQPLRPGCFVTAARCASTFFLVNSSVCRPCQAESSHSSMVVMEAFPTHSSGFCARGRAWFKECSRQSADDCIEGRVEDAADNIVACPDETAVKHQIEVIGSNDGDQDLRSVVAGRKRAPMYCCTTSCMKVPFQLPTWQFWQNMCRLKTKHSALLK